MPSGFWQFPQAGQVCCSCTPPTVPCETLQVTIPALDNVGCSQCGSISGTYAIPEIAPVAGPLCTTTVDENNRYWHTTIDFGASCSDCILVEYSATLGISVWLGQTAQGENLLWNEPSPPSDCGTWNNLEIPYIFGGLKLVCDNTGFGSVFITAL